MRIDEIVVGKTYRGGGLTPITRQVIELDTRASNVLVKRTSGMRQGATEYWDLDGFAGWAREVVE